MTGFIPRKEELHAQMIANDHLFLCRAAENRPDTFSAFWSEALQKKIDGCARPATRDPPTRGPAYLRFIFERTTIGVPSKSKASRRRLIRYRSSPKWNGSGRFVKNTNVGGAAAACVTYAIFGLR